MDKEKLIPQLRFTDFNDEWSTYKLSDLTEQIKRKKENITDEDNILTISANKGFITQKERWDDVIAGNSLKKYTYLKKDEFSYNRGNSKSFKYGCIYRLNYENALVPNVYHSFKIINGNINFFEQLFKSKQLDKQLIKIITSTARMDGLLNISAKNFFNIDINIPNNLKEQKLIGDFLKLIDIKIDLLENMYNNYLNFKKYWMQQIFTQKIRFNIDSSYSTYKLKDIVTKFSTGLNPRKNFKLNDGGENFYVTIKNFQNGILNLDDRCDKIDDNALKLINKRSDLQKDDLIFASIGRVGEVYLIKNKPINWNINESVFSLRPNKQFIEPKFLYYLLNSNKVQNYFKSNITGSTFKSIKMKDLKSTPVTIPDSFELQNEIIKFLTSLDSKILFIDNELNNMVKFKKGLLQQMFV